MVVSWSAVRDSSRPADSRRTTGPPADVQLGCSRWEAPGSLELVRTLLNTGLPTGDGGRERLFDLRADPARWATNFPDVSRPDPGRLDALVELRDGLLRLLAVDPAPADAAWLSGWYRRTGLRARVLVENDELVTRLTCPARSGLAGRVVKAVAEALTDGTWSRLRRCPDCQLVFWDRTRNASKIWCGMYAGTDGRACGSIAKVRRYRARRAASTPGLDRPETRPLSASP
jgi:predicted RNA-binding Zn ribbon-like protein